MKKIYAAIILIIALQSCSTQISYIQVMKTAPVNLDKIADYYVYENDTVKQKRLELQLSHVIHPLIPSYQFIFILAPSNCIFL